MKTILDDTQGKAVYVIVESLPDGKRQLLLGPDHGHMVALDEDAAIALSQIILSCCLAV